uniref:Uncharacterized protein n=1 Tax=Parascaris equorum TaxID=6256 RepID=A0A914RC46_PAREQ
MEYSSRIEPLLSHIFTKVLDSRHFHCSSVIDLIKHDEELAELEKEDATRRQKKLDAALQAVRFDDLGFISSPKVALCPSFRSLI